MILDDLADGSTVTIVGWPVWYDIEPRRIRKGTPVLRVRAIDEESVRAMSNLALLLREGLALRDPRKS